MVKNMYDEYVNYNSLSEYSSEEETSDYEDDPLYREYFREYTNEELDYMHENYPGKYVGESFRKFPKIVDLNSKNTFKRYYGQDFINNIRKLEPISLNFFKKDTKNEININEIKLEVKDNKPKKTWNTNNNETINKNITQNIEYPSLNISKQEIKDLIKIKTDFETNNWVEVKQKKKKLSSPTSSVKTNTTCSSTNSNYTKLCSYFVDKKECPHKNKCRYAHGIDQLVIKNCSFDKECRFIKFQNNKYYNLNSEKICKYIHSFENKEEYFKRINNENKINNSNSPKIKKIFNPINEEIKNEENKNKEEILDVKEEIIDEDDWITIKKKDKSRDKAFDILGDKDKIKEKLKYTKLCLSVINNTHCPHKNKCRFAHDIKDLVIRECLFKDDCNYIKKEIINNNTFYKNISKTKICDCKHKNESLNNYYQRLGLKLSNDNKIIKINKK